MSVPAEDSMYPQYTIPAHIINYGVGQPATDLLPLDIIRKSAAARFAEEDPLLLQYGYINGYRKIREVLANFLEETGHYGGKVDPNELFITNGNTGAVVLITSLFARAGDLVFCEEPTYFLMIRVFAEDFKLRTEGIPMDENGMRVDVLEEKLKAGARPKIVYTIPIYHNPTGYTLSDERRKKLVELSEEYGFLIVSDEAYQLLGFPQAGAPLPPMISYDRKGTVFSLGTFSKILCPGLRIGWINAKKSLLDVIALSGQLDSSGGITPVVSGIVHSCIEMGLLKENLAKVRTELGNRSAALSATLREKLPAYATFKEPQGGYFVWIQLESHMSAAALLDYARAHHNVAFHPGNRFSACGALGNFVRLSVSYYDMERLIGGVDRLAAALREMNEKGWPSIGPVTLPKVAVHGATGRLGSLIAAEATKPTSPIQYIGGIGRNDSVPDDCDLVIDVSGAAGCAALIPKLKGQRLVVGSTGNLPLDALREYSKKACVAIVPNFSNGVPVMEKILQVARAGLGEEWKAEIIEAHHNTKLDAPSGTAKRLRQALVTDTDHVPTHSIRVGDTIGEHTAFIAGPGERLELKHVATKREVFAIGAVRIATQMMKQGPGLIHI